MKKVNLIVGLLFFSTFINAQITLLHENTPFNSLIGDFQKAVATNIGSGGANQTWDFSGMQSTPTYQQMMKTTNEPSIPHSDLFPEADFVFRTHSLPTISNDTTWMFYSTHPDRYEVIGQYSQYQNELCIYSDNELARPVPFNYMDSGFDTFSQTCPQSTFTIYKTGDITWNYDGYGTLIMPHGTFNNVGRVKMVKNQVAHSIMGIDTLVTTNYELTAYSYFNNSGIGLYTIAYIDVFGTSMGTPFSIPTDTSGTYSTMNLASLELLETESNGITVHPNPCTDYISINNAATYQNYIIVDAFGKIVASELMNESEKIEVKLLTPGSYHLLLRNGERVLSKKFIKQ